MLLALGVLGRERGEESILLASIVSRYGFNLHLLIVCVLGMFLSRRVSVREVQYKENEPPRRPITKTLEIRRNVHYETLL